MLRVNDTATRTDNGARVRVVAVLPLNRQVFYRIEAEHGGQSLVTAEKLRPASERSC